MATRKSRSSKSRVRKAAKASRKKKTPKKKLRRGAKALARAARKAGATARRAKKAAKKAVKKLKTPKKSAKKRSTKKKPAARRGRAAKKAVKTRKKTAKAKKPAKRKTVKRAAVAQAISPVLPEPVIQPAGYVPTFNERAVGRVVHYYSRLQVAVVQLEQGGLQVGDTIHIKGHTTDIHQQVDSLEIEHRHIERAGPGSVFGMKVIDHVREHDVVYKVVS